LKEKKTVLVKLILSIFEAKNFKCVFNDIN